MQFPHLRQLPPWKPPKQRRLQSPAAAPQGLEPTGAAVLDYDDIRLIHYERAMQPYPETDYYTMCKDGLWGLMRSDGTEVLSLPRAGAALFECDIDEDHWHGYLDGLAREETNPLEREYNARLKASGERILCDAHDGGGYLGFVDLQDNALHIYYGSLGPGELEHRPMRTCCSSAAAPTALCLSGTVRWRPRGTAGSTTLGRAVCLSKQRHHSCDDLITVRQIF